MAGGGVEGDVNRHYGEIRVDKGAELRSASRVRDGGKTEIEKGSVAKVTGETCRKVNVSIE